MITITGEDLFEEMRGAYTSCALHSTETHKYYGYSALGHSIDNNSEFKIVQRSLIIIARNHSQIVKWSS